MTLESEGQQIDSEQTRLFRDHKKLAHEHLRAQIARLADQSQVLELEDVILLGFGDTDPELLDRVTARSKTRPVATQAALDKIEVQADVANQFYSENVAALTAQAKAFGVSRASKDIK
jgi:hypothetical protein